MKRHVHHCTLLDMLSGFVNKSLPLLEIFFLAAREPWDLFIQDWSDILTLKHLCNIFASGKGAIALSFSKWQRGLGCIALCFRNASVTHRVFMSVCKLQFCFVNTVCKHYRKYKFDLNVLFLNAKCFKIKSVNRNLHY